MTADKCSQDSDCPRNNEIGNFNPTLTFPCRQVYHPSLDGETSAQQFTSTEKSAELEPTTDVPDLKVKPPDYEQSVFSTPETRSPVPPAPVSDPPPSVSDEIEDKTANTQKQNASKDVERDLLHRPLEGLPELIDQAEHNLDHLSENLDSKRLNELSKVSRI